MSSGFLNFLDRKKTSLLRAWLPYLPRDCSHVCHTTPALRDRQITHARISRLPLILLQPITRRYWLSRYRAREKHKAFVPRAVLCFNVCTTRTGHCHLVEVGMSQSCFLSQQQGELVFAQQRALSTALIGCQPCAKTDSSCPKCRSLQDPNRLLLFPATAFCFVYVPRKTYRKAFQQQEHLAQSLVTWDEEQDPCYSQACNACCQPLPQRPQIDQLGTHRQSLSHFLTWLKVACDRPAHSGAAVPQFSSCRGESRQIPPH